jgi:hypothetical protein
MLGTLVIVPSNCRLLRSRPDATRLYWIPAFALHSDGQRSHVVAVRSAPHVRGVVAIAVTALFGLPANVLPAVTTRRLIFGRGKTTAYRNMWTCGEFP